MPFSKNDPNINREGRPPKGKSFTDVLNRIMDEQLQSMDGMEKREALMRKLVKAAFDGEQWAMNAVMDRIDGKPTQKVDQTNKNLTVHINQDDADAAL